MGAVSARLSGNRPEIQLCARETSNKANNCFHCLVLLIYAIAWAVLFGQRPKLPEWDTALKKSLVATFNESLENWFEFKTKKDD